MMCDMSEFVSCILYLYAKMIVASVSVQQLTLKLRVQLVRKHILSENVRVLMY